MKSWLILGSTGGSIKQGVMHIATPIDPLFILIPLLDSHKHSFKSLRDILLSSSIVSEHMDDLLSLDNPVVVSKLDQLCDVQKNPDFPELPVFYRLNNDKVVEWLYSKVMKIVDLAEDTPMLALSSAQASDGAELLKKRVAFQAISDHLDDHWMTQLQHRLDLTEDVHLKATSEIIDHKTAAGLKRPSGQETKKPVTKSRKKELVNNKKLTSFFVKKPQVK